MEKRIEKCTYTIDKIIYICSDGMEFEIESDARAHEDSLIKKREIKMDYIELNSLDCYGAYCYYITEEDDLKYLEVTSWAHNGFYKYKGPGWYMAIKYDGGDYSDSYEITLVEDYIHPLEEDINKLKHLTSN